MKIYLGDNIEVLKTIPDNSVDAIVTDPPYGLSFMGKKWDYDVPSVEVWRECLRVLKPGGHLLSFAGTRTQHRMAVNIEDAGFEIRDMIAWVYGCLSEDTEILTTEGWKLYHKNINNDTILCYDIDKDEFSFNKPLRSFIYENKHTAYNIQSDYTDQIVSRNHRVIVERNGRKIFKCAEELETKENIPFLESLYDLPETIYDFRSCTSITKHDLLKRVQGQKNKFEKKGEIINTIRKTEENKFDLSCMWEIFSNTHMPYKKIKNSYLFKKMQRILQRSRVENTCSQRSPKLETGKRNTPQRTNDWRNESSMEGWCNISQAEGVIYKSENKICQMPGRIHINGEKGRICNGTQTINSKTNKETIIENRMCPSYQSRCNRQQIGKSNVIQYKCGTQKIRRTNATIREIEYNGNVWCVEVPTGSFVARRNGKIFITGNSGFPKSLSIGKAMDKLQGNEREVVGISNNGSGAQPSKLNNHEKGDTGIGYMDGSGKVFEITKVTSEFEGWGTALKPALEPITLARKPLEKGLTVAENCLKWGTGGINIDGCRVELNGENPPSGSAKRVFASNQFTEEKVYGENKVTSPQGRFPANLIHDGSDEVVGLFPQTKSGSGIKKKATGTANGIFNINKIDGEYLNGDSGSAARFFYCPKASKAERNRGCEGLPVKTAAELTGRKEGSKGLSGSEEHGNSTNPYANGGSVLPRANYHPTVKPIALMEYLVKLVSREGQTVLDPFAGSGTTGIACKNLNRNAILIEREAEYVEIAKARIDYVKNQMKSSKNTVNIFFRKEDEL